MILASGLIIFNAFTSFVGWEQSEVGWKYKDDTTNVYVTSQWIESASEKGLWYYINADGVMATNAWIDDLYYVNEAGEWREIEPVDWESHRIDFSNVTAGEAVDDSSAQNFLDYWNNH